MAVELKDLTKRSENYSQWYNELVVKADLAEQSAVRVVWLSSLTDTLYGRKCNVSWTICSRKQDM